MPGTVISITYVLFRLQLKLIFFFFRAKIYHVSNARFDCIDRSE